MSDEQITEKVAETEARNEARQAARLSREAPQPDDPYAAERTTKQWYVIHTYSGYENKVKANLEHRDIGPDRDRHGEHDKSQVDDRLARGPGDLLQLGPGLSEVLANASEHDCFSSLLL